MHTLRPALPVGAFSYSEGLEALVQGGRLDGVASVERWLLAELEGQPGERSVPAPRQRQGSLRQRGAKVLMYHGVSDAIFSASDTEAFMQRLEKSAGGRAAVADFARYFPVPGMAHCSAGPATDQFDALTPLVRWVEQGQAPDGLLARARGPGNAGGANPEVPAAWGIGRSRVLCPWPTVSRYNGTGSLDDAANFSCR